MRAPLPGESLTEAAHRRLAEELGAGPVPLTEVGAYVYRAEDPATGRVEVEYDHVLRGELSPDTVLRPDPTEVAELRWVDPATLATTLTTDPDSYAPWLGGVLDRLLHPSERSGGR
nr:NUDIX domain-containing protein [Micromonospora endophytica]